MDISNAVDIKIREIICDLEDKIKGLVEDREHYRKYHIKYEAEARRLRIANSELLDTVEGLKREVDGTKIKSLEDQLWAANQIIHQLQDDLHITRCLRDSALKENQQLRDGVVALESVLEEKDRILNAFAVVKTFMRENDSIS